MNKRLFVLLTLMFVLLSTETLHATYNKSLPFVQTGQTVTGLDRLTFESIDGNSTQYSYKPWQTEFEGALSTVFFLEDPINPGSLQAEYAMPSYLPEDLISAIMVLSITKDPLEYSSALTDQLFDASIQVALWKVVAPTSQKKKLITSTIHNDLVDTVSAQMIADAEEMVSRTPNSEDVFEYNIPTITATIDTTEVKGEVDGTFNYYGPYYIRSDIGDLVYAVRDSGNTYAITNTIGGANVSEVRINEPFYVKYNNSYTSDITIGLDASGYTYDLKVFSDKVFTHKLVETSSLEQTIFNSKSVATITYTKYDDILKTAIPGVVIQVCDNTGLVIETITTDVNGLAQTSGLKPGVYRLQELSTVDPYSLDPSIYEVSLDGNGSIENIQSPGYSDGSKVTFMYRDISNGSYIGGAIYRIVDNTTNEEIKKIGFNDEGICKNIDLERNKSYRLEQITAPDGYEFTLTHQVFETEESLVNVVIEGTPSFNKTTFKFISDGDGVQSTFNIFGKNTDAYASFDTGEDGIITLSFPEGMYYLRRTNSDIYKNTVDTNFNVSASNTDTTVVIELSTYEGSIQGTVTNTQGEPIQGLKLVAVSDTGIDYSTTSSDFDGSYSLENIPNSAVIFIEVLGGSFGMSGEIENNRAIVNGVVQKDLTVYSLEEVNSQLDEDSQLLAYPFYVEGSGERVSGVTVDMSGFNVQPEVVEVVEEVEEGPNMVVIFAGVGLISLVAIIFIVRARK